MAKEASDFDLDPEPMREFIGSYLKECENDDYLKYYVAIINEQVVGSARV